MADADYIAGLLRERAMLAQAGDTDRVAQVEAELERMGYETTAAAPVKETAVIRTAARRRKPKR